MKKNNLKKLTTIKILIVLGTAANAQSTNPSKPQNLTGYALAAIIGIGILCYLLYALFKPEKF
jgi:K+-transporting ATPase KdpF subunit